MKPVKFPQQTITLGKGQPEYIPLPAYLDTPNPQNPNWKRYIFKYEFSELDLAIINKSKSAFFTIQGYGFNPILPGVDNPFESLVIEYIENECWVPLEDGEVYHIQATSAADMVDQILERFTNLKAENLVFVEKPLLSISPEGEIKEI